MAKKPGRIVVRGETFAAVVFRVEEWDKEGRPRRMSAYYNNERIDISEGSREFIIAYVTEASLRPKVQA